MRLLALYRPNSEFASRVEEYAREFERRDATRKIELMDIDSSTGSNIAQLYDVTNQPAILALADDSQLLQMWQGSEMPLMDDVAAYNISGTSFLSSSTHSYTPDLSVAAHK